MPLFQRFCIFHAQKPPNPRGSRSTDTHKDCILVVTLEKLSPHPSPMLNTALSTIQIIALSAVLGGCGAKTGLYEPEFQRDEVVLEEDSPCVSLDIDGEPIELPLQTETRLRRADVVFLIDVTASMQDEIERIRDQLRDKLAPAIREQIEDVSFAVATFGDFPVRPFGDFIDHPYRLVLASTDDVFRAQAAMNTIRLGNGGDEPESHVEGLYQLATGEGLGGYVPASFGCPSGGLGYACLREDALPIVLLFTDASFHNGPGGSQPYSGAISPAPHTYDDARDALEAIGARVIGFDSGEGTPAAHLRQLALDTRATNTLGLPLVYDIGRRGERLGTGVIDAMHAFAQSVEFDVDLRVMDVDPLDGVDASLFVERVIPARASPENGILDIDEDAGRFLGVKSGTQLFFQLVLKNDAVVPGPDPQTFEVEVQFRGDDRTLLGSTTVEFVVPGEDGKACEVRP